MTEGIVDVAGLRATLTQPDPPNCIPSLVQALWYAANDQWDSAHRIAQNDASAGGAWVHAYLHRVEGDEANAGYWYNRAGKPHCRKSLDDEWAEIAEALLNPAPL